MKKILNPKRIKIIAGIIFILCFGFTLDYFFPKAGISEIPQRYDYANELNAINSWILEFYNEKGELPSVLYGGDLKGWSNCGKCLDPIISAGITTSYPKIYQDSLALQKAFIRYKMQYPQYRCYFGKDGNVMGNVDLMNPKSLHNCRFGSAGNPLAGQFYYQRFKSPHTGFMLLIMHDTFKGMRPSQFNRLEFIHGWLEDDKVSDYISICDSFVAGSVSYIGDDGKWVTRKYYED
jgi:hypothetical protein